MMDKTRWCLLLVHVHLLLLEGQARRNLTEITYRFTNCNSAQYNGPRVEDQCRPFYQHMNSRIVADPDTLFQFDSDTFRGAQGFRLPKDGLYNITIAGARGGEGICNFVYGKGSVLKIQARLSTDYEYLIMVGHRGTSVCEVPENANHPVCQHQRPTTFEETFNCDAIWESFVNSTSDVANFFYGGGGGGGASMIWLRERNSQQFTDLPFVIAPGGGGASAILLYYNISDSDFNLSIPTYVSTLEELYEFHVNGHFGKYYLDWMEGVRGYRTSGGFIPTSGAGGGWTATTSLRTTPVDGKVLNQKESFAEGGVECSTTLDSPIFTGVFGGYGGGGGGCDSGGGGGGYTGGHVFGTTRYHPGSGGEYAIFNFTVVNVVDILYNDGNGYVEIVSSNCECAGQCVVYSEEGQFECLCPNDTILAQDKSNCYQERIIKVEEIISTPTSLDEVNIQVQEVPLEALDLLSVSAEVTVTNDRVKKRQTEDLTQSDGNLHCQMVLFRENSTQLLLSNLIREPLGTINQLSQLDLNSADSRTPLVSILPSPMTVTHILLLSTGLCTLANNTAIRANVSIITPDTELASPLPYSVLQELAEYWAQQQGITVPTDLTVPVAADNSGVIAGSSTVVALLVILCVGVIIIVVYSKRKHEIRKIRAQRFSNSIMELNTSYVRYNEGPRTIQEKDGYTALHVDAAKGSTTIFQSESYSNAQLQPLYGISIPQVDFYSYNKQRFTTDWGYPRSNLTYMRELREGQFGKVLLMEAKDIAGYKGKIPVAVKTLTSRDPVVIGKFAEEAELMKKFTHSNIVSLLGFIEQKEGEDSAPLMILEYMPYGDLHRFLVDNRPVPNKTSPLKKLHFYTFAYDVAKGLEFLSSNKYVHRDIATRNCLVGSGLQIKIADFGLARGVNNKDYYRIAGSAVLPVRWMSPESLLLGKFSSASDVWAYGVLLWEILTFGEQPLSDENVQDIIEAAQRETLQHSIPRNAPDDLCQLIAQCHQLNVEARPSFGDIVAMELFDVVNQRPPLPPPTPLQLS